LIWAGPETKGRVFHALDEQDCFEPVAHASHRSS
jgi:hypothetical protein